MLTFQLRLLKLKIKCTCTSVRLRPEYLYKINGCYERIIRQKNTSSIQSTKVRQERQNRDIKENQLIFLNLLWGCKQSETLGVSSKASEDCINHRCLETLVHVIEIWK